MANLKNTSATPALDYKSNALYHYHSLFREPVLVAQRSVGEKSVVLVFENFKNNSYKLDKVEMVKNGEEWELVSEEILMGGVGNLLKIKKGLESRGFGVTIRHNPTLKEFEEAIQGKREGCKILVDYFSSDTVHLTLQLDCDVLDRSKFIQLKTEDFIKSMRGNYNCDFEVSVHSATVTDNGKVYSYRDFLTLNIYEEDFQQFVKHACVQYLKVKQASKKRDLRKQKKVA